MHTKEQIRTFMKSQLSSNKTWAVNGLMRIYGLQTNDERINSARRIINGIGFTSVDKVILTDFARKLIAGSQLTELQMNTLMNKMPKYWEQLYKISNKDLLDAQILSAQKQW